MKKIAVLLVFVIVMLLAACGEAHENFSGSEVQESQSGDASMDVSFETGSYIGKPWTESHKPYKYDVIPNKEVALQVAIQIYEGMERGKTAPKFEAESVFFDEEDEVWVVAFSDPQKKNYESTGIITVGGNHLIAIQKKDGKVLRIWYDE